MISLSIFTNVCNWWFVWWLLPFILGLWLGYLLWGKFVRKTRELEDRVASKNEMIKDLESKLIECEKRKNHYKEGLSISESRIKDLQEKLDNKSGTPPADKKRENIVLADKKPADEIQEDEQATSVPVTPVSPQSSGKYSMLKMENLKIIEGIGPAMESVLQENGIENWAALAEKNVEEIKGILDKYGDKYKIIDPSNWPAQARLASEGRWEELIRLQSSDGSGSKVERLIAN